jgi:acetamidase/formamidase
MKHSLDRSTVVNRWSCDYPPRLRIQPGDTVEVQTRDASDAQVHAKMTSEEFAGIDTTRIHALTGPIFIEGAEPGDRLIIKILKYQHEGWAWTSIIPGLGLLADDFKEHFLHIWELEENVTRSMPGLTIPLAPFCGIIGVQPGQPGEMRTRPPGVYGGNMDVRHLIAGSTLHLPVITEGAGLCLGDAHAAQGDGEVSINGMETPMTVTIEVDLDKGSAPVGPYIECPLALDPPVIANNPHHIFVESDPEPMEAARRVVRRAIDYLVKRLGLTPEQAYVTCSVTIRLKLSQVVNVPQVTVSGYLPEGIFN